VGVVRGMEGWPCRSDILIPGRCEPRGHRVLISTLSMMFDCEYLYASTK
jgi:hypothetical protein